MRDASRSVRGPAGTAILGAFCVFLVAACSACGGGNSGGSAQGPRDPRWAVPVARPGLENFFQVTDEIYRGAQPSEEGIRELKKLGVKTVINLREFHSDADEIADTGLKSIRIKFRTSDPEEEEIVRFLKAVTDKGNLPAFVHCQHGSDRTGMMIACYRIVVQGWSNADAEREMVEGGYGYHLLWKDIRTTVRNLDAAKFRKMLGL